MCKNEIYRKEISWIKGRIESYRDLAKKGAKERKEFENQEILLRGSYTYHEENKWKDLGYHDKYAYYDL